MTQYPLKAEALYRRQISPTLNAIHARLAQPGLPFEEGVVLQKEILDLQKQLTDIARPFSSNPENV